jgi:hypothetical protein
MTFKELSKGKTEFYFKYSRKNSIRKAYFKNDKWYVDDFDIKRSTINSFYPRSFYDSNKYEPSSKEEWDRYLIGCI